MHVTEQQRISTTHTASIISFQHINFNWKKNLIFLLDIQKETPHCLDNVTAYTDLNR